MNTGCNYSSTANKYGCSYGQVYAWVRKYKDKGIEGLYDRRGKNKAISQLSDIEKLKAENRLVNYSATELPEHLKSGGIPPFFRVRP